MEKSYESIDSIFESLGEHNVYKGISKMFDKPLKLIYTSSSSNYTKYPKTSFGSCSFLHRLHPEYSSLKEISLNGVLNAHKESIKKISKGEISFEEAISPFSEPITDLKDVITSVYNTIEKLDVKPSVKKNLINILKPYNHKSKNGAVTNYVGDKLSKAIYFINFISECGDLQNKVTVASLVRLQHKATLASLLRYDKVLPSKISIGEEELNYSAPNVSDKELIAAVPDYLKKYLNPDFTVGLEDDI